MSLSAKLEEAKRKRLILEGKLPPSAALAPAPEVPQVDLRDQRSSLDPITIEVPPTGLHPVAPPAVDPMHQAAGERCPSCQSLGRVDMVDLVGHRTHLTCVRCGAMWQVHAGAPAPNH